MQKSYEIKNKYNSEDEVIITIREEIQQPPIVKESTVSVLGLKNRIKDIDNTIANLQIERSNVQAILDNNKDIIANAVIS